MKQSHKMLSSLSHTHTPSIAGTRGSIGYMQQGGKGAMRKGGACRKSGTVRKPLTLQRVCRHLGALQQLSEREGWNG